MKDLIVYYSLEGNTEYVVEKIKSRTGADTLCLVPKKAYRDKGFAKFLLGGMSAVRADKPELEDYEVNLAEYERVIFGFPVWASNFTPPLRTFVRENADALEGKRFTAFACQSGAGAEKAFGKLAKELGIPGFEMTAVFIDPRTKASAEKDAQIEEFCEALTK